MYVVISQNTHLITRMTLARKSPNSVYSFSENVLEAGIFVICLLCFTYAIFESSERNWNEWIPTVKTLFVLALCMLISSKLFLLLGEEIGPKAGRIALYFHFGACLVYKVLNFAFYTDNFFIVNRGDNDMADVLKTVLKVVIGLAIASKDGIEFMSRCGLLAEKYEDHVLTVSIIFWVVMVVYLVIIFSFFCMICCNPTIK